MSVHVREAILLKLNEHYEENPGRVPDDEDLAEALGLEDRAEVRRNLEILESEGLLDLTRTGGPTHSARITGAGLAAAEEIGEKRKDEERLVTNVGKLLDGELPTLREKLRRGLSQKLAEFGGQGVLYSSASIRYAAQLGEQHVAAAEERILQAWLRALHAFSAPMAEERVIGLARERLSAEAYEATVAVNSMTGQIRAQTGQNTEINLQRALDQAEKRLTGELELALAERSRGVVVVEKVRGESDESVKPREVFVVHGHDEALRESVARLIERLGLQAVILHEQPNKGQTIIEKLERHQAVAYAVVLLSPDDVGAKAGEEELRSRARQNVIFELGFFVGVLGRDRVAVLLKGEVERPSDWDGVTYIEVDPAGAWKTVLGRELREAGFRIDLDGVS